MRDEIAEAIKEVLEWIDNWSPSFVDDDEWPATRARIDAALTALQEQPAPVGVKLERYDIAGAAHLAGGTIERSDDGEWVRFDDIAPAISALQPSPDTKTTPASDPRLDEWLALASAATPGPWEARGYINSYGELLEDGRCFIEGGLANLADDVDEANAAFIAAAREAIPQLIGMVRERDAKLAKLRKWHKADLFDTLLPIALAVGLPHPADQTMTPEERREAWNVGGFGTNAANHIRALEARATAAEERVRELEAGLKDTLASLVAATSLLSRSPKTAAPSDKMFDQMLADYEASVERARNTLGRQA